MLNALKHQFFYLAFRYLIPCGVLNFEGYSSCPKLDDFIVHYRIKGVNQCMSEPSCQQNVVRKLAAIMFTDIVGYTALTAHDE